MTDTSLAGKTVLRTIRFNDAQFAIIFTDGTRTDFGFTKVTHNDGSGKTSLTVRTSK